MKNNLKIIQFIICSFFLIGWTASFSQSETKTETMAANQDSIVNYITPLEYAFMMHEETSWLIKLNTNLEYGWQSRNYLKIGFEKRIAPSFTLNLSFDQVYNDYLGDDLILTNGIQGSVESRWYYRLNKRIKQNRVARSMSDNYFAIGFGYTYFFTNNEFPIEEPLSNKSISLFMKWGLQRRFLKYGHADMGIKAGISTVLNQEFSPSFVLNTYVNLGLGFTKDKLKLDHNKLCPVLKCYDSDKFIIKSNFSSLFSITLLKQYKSIVFVPHIAIESKIANSSFSINTEIQAVHFNRWDAIRFEGNSWRAGLTLEGRWYYNLKRRMLKGKTGNSFSASYITVGGNYTYSKTNWEPSGHFQPGIHVASGWQRLFSKHMYYDIQLGYEYQHYYRPNPKNNFSIDPRIRLSLGYKF